MLDPVRQEVIALAHTVVVKVGTNVLAGPDGYDPRQYNVKTDAYTKALGGDVKGVKIGVVKEGFGHPNSERDVDALWLPEQALATGHQHVVALGVLGNDPRGPLRDDDRRPRRQRQCAARTRRRARGRIRSRPRTTAPTASRPTAS